MCSIRAVDVRVNNLIDPIGINCGNVEISWQVAGDVFQGAFRINAAYSVQALESGELICDTVEQGSCCRYILSVPQSKCRIYFRIMLQGSNGESGGWSGIHFFETGFAAPEEFHASWMGFPVGWSGHALVFRKTFNFSGQARNARLYVAGGTVYSRLNGTPLGEQAVLQPSQSDYAKSYHYLTYDVTGLLVQGENTLVFHVGSGWAGVPVLKYQLENDRETVVFSCAGNPPEVAPSPICLHSLYGGEFYDARLEFDVSQPLPFGRAAQRMAGFSGVPRGFEEEPIVPAEEISPVSWRKMPSGSTVVDFGRNFAGWCRLAVCAPSGTVVTMRFAEQLYEDGSINQQNLQGDYAADTYIAKGSGDVEVYEPHFTYHGFRYVEISGIDFTPDMLTGVVLRAGCRRAGFFKCSDPLLNDIFEMMLHTEESNLFAVPTDCPQRTERMGWLNDMMARNEGAAYLFDASNVYTKYLRDAAEAQDEKTGEIPMTAPFYWALDIDPVCSSFIEIAWNSYRFYGKKAQLYNLYPNMCRWMDCLLACRDEDGIMRKGGFVGDWCPPLKFNGEVESPRNTSVPQGLVSTALIYYSLCLMEKIAALIDNHEDAERFAVTADEVKKDFLAVFRHSNGRLNTESQCAYAFALYCGLFSESECCSAAERLAELFAANGFKHTTGNIGTKYLLEVLSRYGYIDHVMKLVSSSDYPGWGYMLANNATTVWERWEIDDGKRLNSLNHPMHSAPCVWMFRHIGGIKLAADSCRADMVELSPEFPEKLDFAEAVYHSASGTYRSHWKRQDGKICWDFEIPSNCRAKIKTPAGEEKIFTCGRYQLVF